MTNPFGRKHENLKMECFKRWVLPILIDGANFVAL